MHPHDRDPNQPNEYAPDSDIARFCRDLTAAMGEGWQVVTTFGYRHGCYLAGPDDIMLFARDLAAAQTQHGWQRYGSLRRIGIHGVYTKEAHSLVSDLPMHKITIDSSREVSVLARDVHRRLLPDVRAEMARINDARTDRATALQSRHLHRVQLAQVLPNVTLDDESDDESDDAYQSTVRSGHGQSGAASTWTLDRYGTTVTIEIGPVCYNTALHIARSVSNILASAQTPPTAKGKGEQDG